jgi:two-component system, OmpR family, response regulator
MRKEKIMAELRHVLCVDDEPDVLSVAQMCLETVGEFTVSTASSGQEALDRAVMLKPDIILLDVMMPGMDGPTTLRALRQEAALDGVPVIFMTARVRTAEIDEYLALGANGVVAKPFDPMLLSTQITELFEAFHAKR